MPVPVWGVADSLFMGLDGGGTSTRAVALDQDGVEVFRGEGGPGNLAAGDPDAAVAQLLAAVQGAPQPVAVAACLAGALDQAKRGHAEASLRARFPGAVVKVEPDWAALPWAASPGTVAVVLAGTGSAVVSRWDGQVRATGGGGPLFGDVGSAFDVVRRWIGLLLAGGREPGEGLRERLAEACGASSVREACGRWAEPGTVRRVAGLAGAVAADASPEASRAVSSAMDALAHQVHAHLALVRHPGGPTPIELAGGLWSASPIFAERLQWALSVTGDAPVHRQYKVGMIAKPAEVGAARMAMELVDGD
jgi:N-acetylglucosamine kinase-like BadF-type ATPase